MNIHPCLLSTIIITCIFPHVQADHGPGTSGSGVVTQTAETLKPLQWSASLQSEWTEFDAPSLSNLSGLTHFDLIARSTLSTLGLSFGVTEDFQLSLSMGYYDAEGTSRIVHDHEGGEHGHHEAHEHGGHDDDHDEIPEFATFDADGFTDLWLSAKYRVYRGPAGQLAVLAGLKFPVGETDVFDSEGERVEPGSMPGTGAWDGMVGTAYTIALTPSLNLDASAQYTFRGERFDYQLGNRFDAGVALGWHVLGGADAFPRMTLLAEVLVRSIGKSEEEGSEEESTGGTSLFLSPGLRISLSRNVGFGVAAQFPVAQDLNGDQVETDYRIIGAVNITF